MSSMRRPPPNPPTPPPPPDVTTLTRQHSNKKQESTDKKDSDGKSSPGDNSKDMDLQRIGPPRPNSGNCGNKPETMNTQERRTRDTSTERMRKIVPQQAYMFHDMVQPELQAILNKRRTKSEPVEV